MDTWGIGFRGVNGGGGGQLSSPTEYRGGTMEN